MDTVKSTQVKVDYIGGIISVNIVKRFQYEYMDMMIYDSLGNVVYETLISQKAGKRDFQYDISHLPVGTYQVLIAKEDHLITIQKIAIRK